MFMFPGLNPVEESATMALIDNEKIGLVRVFTGSVYDPHVMFSKVESGVQTLCRWPWPNL